MVPMNAPLRAMRCHGMQCLHTAWLLPSLHAHAHQARISTGLARGMENQPHCVFGSPPRAAERLPMAPIQGGSARERPVAVSEQLARSLSDSGVARYLLRKTLIWRPEWIRSVHSALES